MGDRTTIGGRWTHTDEAALRALPDLLADVPGTVAEDLRAAITTVRIWDGEAAPWLALERAIRDARIEVWACAPIAQPHDPMWDVLDAYDYAIAPILTAIAEQVAALRGGE